MAEGQRRRRRQMTEAEAKAEAARRAQVAASWLGGGGGAGGVEGMARFGLQVFSAEPNAAAAQAVVELGSVVVAPVGQDWSRL